MSVTGVAPSLTPSTFLQVASGWKAYLQFCTKEDMVVEDIVDKAGNDEIGTDLRAGLQKLSSHGLGKFVAEHFLASLEREFKEKHVTRFWHRLNKVQGTGKDFEQIRLKYSRWNAWVDNCLHTGLAELAGARERHLVRLAELAGMLASDGRDPSEEVPYWRLASRYTLAVGAILHTSAPAAFPGLLRWYYGWRILELQRMVSRRAKPDGVDGEGCSGLIGSGNRGGGGEGDSPASCVGERDFSISGTPPAGTASRRISTASEDHTPTVAHIACDEEGAELGDGDNSLERRRRRRRSSSISGMSGAERGESVGGEEDGAEDGVEDMEGVDYYDGERTSLDNIASTTAGLEAAKQVAGNNWVLSVGKIARQLRELGLEDLSDEAYSSVLYDHLKKKILAVASGNYERPLLAPLLRAVGSTPILFLCCIFSQSSTHPHSPPPDAPHSEPSSQPEPMVVTPSSPAPPGWQPAGASVAEEAGSASDALLLRWRLRLEYFVHETLGSLRISELFDIIVDYPESLPALHDLRQCLLHTGDHARLVSSFQGALHRRLLTAGAATTDILQHYVSTIKSLRALDPSGVILEAVGDSIKEYLRNRKDTIRCVITMLTDDSGGAGGGRGGAGAAGGGLGIAGGESLFEELGRGQSHMEGEESEDETGREDEAALEAAMRWEPDPVEADPSKARRSRRSMDIISMLVGIYGSKELFVNEYRVLLADKLLAKVEYDTDRDIRTVELLKLRFGDSNMHNCEVMLKDMADSKRINANIKHQLSLAPPPTSPTAAASSAGGTGAASPAPPRNLIPRPPGAIPTATASASRTHYATRLHPEGASLMSAYETVVPPPEHMHERAPPRPLRGLGQIPTPFPVQPPPEPPPSVEALNATIVSSLFWPPLEGEEVKLPVVVDRMMDMYAQRYHATKSPRKLMWKKQLGTVKLELTFEDRAAQFVVSPIHAAIILQFESREAWSVPELAEAVGLTVPTLLRKIMLWVNQGVLVESQPSALGSDLVYTVVKRLEDAGGRGGGGGGGGGGSGSGASGPEGMVVPFLAEEERESAVVSMEDQWEQEMVVYEKYVMNMLANMDSLPLERIHNMLKMYVVEPAYDKTLQQLQAFLGKLVSEEKIELRDGVYISKAQ